MKCISDGDSCKLIEICELWVLDATEMRIIEMRLIEIRDFTVHMYIPMNLALII